ncbi:MAG: outer membrane lipoprotein carrier protein LolA [Chloroflexi bacterium]|nr:outer membrane lipoprotein carrier protein LolA [Chloroflexota bacterium]
MKRDEPADARKSQSLEQQLQAYYRDELRHVRTPNDFWSRLEDRLEPQAPLPWHRRILTALRPTARPLPRYLAPALAIVLVLALLATLSNVLAPASVNAAELIQRAQAALTVATFEGTIVFVSQFPTDQPLHSEQRVWFRAPKDRRFEIRGPVPGLEGDTGPVRDMIVTDGATAWHYSVDQQRVLVSTAQGLDRGATAFDVANLEGVFATIKQAYQGTVRGSDRIAGRDSYIVDLTATGDRADQIVPQMTLWIDKATFVVLATEDRDARGRLLRSWKYTDIRYNVQLADSLFELQPPAGAEIVNLSTSGLPSEAELATLWQGIAQSAPFSIFRPTYVPAGLTARQPSYDPALGVVQGFQSASNPTALSITQQPAAMAQAAAEGETVDIQGAPGRYRETADVYEVVIERNGTLIIVQIAKEQSRDELLKVARSLTPVGR